MTEAEEFFCNTKVAMVQSMLEGMRDYDMDFYVTYYVNVEENEQETLILRWSRMGGPVLGDEGIEAAIMRNMIPSPVFVPYCNVAMISAEGGCQAVFPTPLFDSEEPEPEESETEDTPENRRKTFQVVH